MSGTLGQSVFQLGFQISPIVLTNGIASALGGMLPIIAITEEINFVQGLLGSGGPTSLNSFFAHYCPIPGGTLLEYESAKFPFANQTVAANAMIKKELTLSLLMTIPGSNGGAYVTKLATMSALILALNTHIGLGGTFTVATPAQIQTDLLLLRISDVSSGEGKQPQMMFQWDFEKPLISSAGAASLQNSLMSQISSGLPTSGATSAAGNAFGNPASGASFITTPMSTNLAASSQFPSAIPGTPGSSVAPVITGNLQ